MARILHSEELFKRLVLMFLLVKQPATLSISLTAQLAVATRSFVQCNVGGAVLRLCRATRRMGMGWARGQQPQSESAAFSAVTEPEHNTTNNTANLSNEGAAGNRDSEGHGRDRSARRPRVLRGWWDHENRTTIAALLVGRDAHNGEFRVSLESGHSSTNAAPNERARWQSRVGPRAKCTACSACFTSGT